MRYFYYDFETRITKDLRLSKMTTRAYCDATNVTMLAWALDGEEIQYHVGTPTPELLERLRQLGEQDDVVFVAFNSSFDSRVLHYTLGLPYPKRMLCAMELSRAAWPNQPGGYSLDNLSATLGLKYRKLKVDLETVQGQELADYCRMDVEVLRDLFQRALKLVDPKELRVCEMSNRAKRLYFEVDQDQVLAAVENMANAAGAAALEVAHAFDDDPEILKAFGWHGDVAPETLDEARRMSPKSVKPHRIKELLLDRLAIDFTKKSISLKKINPAELAEMPNAGKVTINKTSELNKALSYGRGLRKFSGVLTVDCELSYAAAHTLRFASRNEGSKGLNLHNCIGLDTNVLTDRGWLPIVDVTTDHLVWDGEAFVAHAGVTYEGDRECLKINNCRLTPEHPVFCPGRIDAIRCPPVHAAAHGLRSILCCLRSLLSDAEPPAAARKPYESGAIPGSHSGAEAATTSSAALALASGFHANCFSSIVDATTTWAYDTELAVTMDLNTLGTGSSLAGGNSKSLCDIAKHYLDGTIRLLKWIESSPAETTSRATYDSLLLSLTRATEGLQSSWPAGNTSRTTPAETASSISRRTIYTDKAVFDIRGAGPRARFQAGGLLVANCPKHNRVIAEPFRRSFCIPDGYIWVRGDFANVEYRVEGLVSGSEYIKHLFTEDLFADPYVAFGEWSTGLKIDPATPAGKALRQIFKAAVLGLGYMMGIRTWMGQLLQVVARGDVSIQDLITLAGERHWSRMRGHTRGAVRFLGCHDIIGIVGEHVHELFHQRHPEFGKLGRWLEAAVSRLSYAHDPSSALAALYELPGAPDRRLLDLFVDRTLGGSSVRARYPEWPASVCWRDLAVRETLRGPCLTSVLAGHKPPRPFTPNVAIENFVQHFARNALVKGQLELEDMGHEYQISIHDEAFILAEDNAESILKARTDMLKVFGPGNALGYGWAININPDSVTVSRSLWDDEKWCQKQFWPRLMAGDDSVIREVA